TFRLCSADRDISPASRAPAATPGEGRGSDESDSVALSAVSWMGFERLVQQPDQRRRTGEKIGQRVIVEYVEKRPLRALQRSFESTGAIDGARIPRGVEALDQVPARFGTTNQAAHSDLGWWSVQAQAAVSPADADNQFLLGQQLDDFDQNVRRSLVGPAYLSDRYEPIVMQSQVD